MRLNELNPKLVSDNIVTGSIYLELNNLYWRFFYMKKGNIEYPITELFCLYVKASLRNKRRKADGTTLSAGTKQNILTLAKLLDEFEGDSQFHFVVTTYSSKNKRVFNQLKRKYATFYKKFCDYLFDLRNQTDNTVGGHIKNLKSFFNWLNTDLGIVTGPFYKQFYVWQEDIPIIVLNQEQLRFLIFDVGFHDSLPPKLQRAKEIFVFGCTVGLRVSDLLTLKKGNLEYTSNGMYLTNVSKKTGIRTTIKLPPYAETIVRKRKHRGSHLFNAIGASNLNRYIKELCELAGFTHEVQKIRRKRGKAYVVKNTYGSSTRFCDLVSTHTMRRTAISTLLNLGVKEDYVRRISGHKAGSKEFYKYVKYNQQKVDTALEEAFKKFTQKTA